MALFSKKAQESSPAETTSSGAPSAAVLWSSIEQRPPQLEELIGRALGVGRVMPISNGQSGISADTQYVVAVGAKPEDLTGLARAVKEQRDRRNDGFPVFAVFVANEALTQFGEWLDERGKALEISGLRLAVTQDIGTIVTELDKFRVPIGGPDVVLMPTAPEIQNSPTKTFFSLSPESRETTRFIGELAQNGVTRIYLLGAPGAGKTTLAYYYWLKRQKGNFITVNLNSESTGDKASMKSLLCGHVAGSSPGAQTREGALSFARDGVCFLDESHGATGSVMQVLMEVLENGQFLPFGATAKRPLECAVLFASNRSWETLRGLMHIDEHARLGATIIEISDLRVRREDQIAVVAATLAKMKSRFTTWKAPKGISAGAWKMILECGWRGNVRSLMRVLESATIEYGRTSPAGDFLTEDHIRPALDLWEPETSHDTVDYASFGARPAAPAAAAHG